MANKNIEVGLKLTADLSGLNQMDDRLRKSLSALDQMVGSLNDKYLGASQRLADEVVSNFETAADQLSNQLDDLGQDALKTFNSLPTAFGQAWDKMDLDWGDLMGQGLAGLLEGGPGDMLEKLWGGLSGDLNKLLGAGLKDISGWLGDLVGGGFGGKLVSSLVGELGSDLVGKVMDLGSDLIGNLFGGGSISPEEAQAGVESTLASLESFFAVLRDGQGSIHDLSGTLAPMAERLMHLGRIAGLTEEEIIDLVTSLDPELGQAFLNLAEPTGQAATALQEFSANTQGFTVISDEAVDQLMQWARAAGISEDEVRRLVEQLRRGEISAQQFADAFSGGAHVFEPFAAGLDNVANSLNGFNQSLNQTNQQVSNLQEFSISDVNFQTAGGQTGQVVYHHSGGRVASYAHGGLLVPRLYHDEVPIIARGGEFVVRAESVDAASLPWLRALNQGARPAGMEGGGVVNLNGPVVEIHGNLLGGDEAAEDLARLVESKLRDLAGGRYG